VIFFCWGRCGAKKGPPISFPTQGDFFFQKRGFFFFFGFLALLGFFRIGTPKKKKNLIWEGPGGGGPGGPDLAYKIFFFGMRKFFFKGFFDAKNKGGGGAKAPTGVWVYSDFFLRGPGGGPFGGLF